MRLRLLLLFVVLGGFTFTVDAQTYIRVDSTVTDTYKILHIQEESVPWNLFVMEIDLTRADLEPRVFLADDKVAYQESSGDITVRKETLESMMDRGTKDGKAMIGGINADFFDLTSGRQFNVTGTEGRIASTGITSTPHAAFFTDENGTPYIDLIEMEQVMDIPGAGELAINSVNRIRRADHLVLYNKFSVDSTSFANKWGAELLLEPLEEVSINGKHRYVVKEKAPNVTRTDDVQVIASGHGVAQQYVDNAVAGDTISITRSFADIADSIQIMEMIGGWGHIVQDGVNTAEASIEEEGTMQHENDRHPRSAVGYNEEKTKLYLVVVDGRSTLSTGMNLDELAGFMTEELNVWDGLNFDGGGSSVLMAGNTTINKPSGGVQRAIPNALVIVRETATSIANLYPEGDHTVIVYPNPATNFITFKWPENDVPTQDMTLNLYSLSGKQIWSKSVDANIRQGEVHCTLPNLKPGHYFYHIRSGIDNFASGKLIIQ